MRVLGVAPTVTNRSQKALSANANGVVDQNVSEERVLAQYYINESHNFDPREHYLNSLHVQSNIQDIGIHDMARIAASQLANDMIEQGITGEEQMRTITEIKNYALARYGLIEDEIELVEDPKNKLYPELEPNQIAQPIPLPQNIPAGLKDRIDIPYPELNRIPLPELTTIQDPQAQLINKEIAKPFEITPQESLSNFSLSTSSARHREVFLYQMITRRNLANAS